METPFGKHRHDNGPGKSKIDMTEAIEILVGHPPQLVKVPSSVEVTASHGK